MKTTKKFYRKNNHNSTSNTAVEDTNENMHNMELDEIDKSLKQMICARVGRTYDSNVTTRWIHPARTKKLIKDGCKNTLAIFISNIYNAISNDWKCMNINQILTPAVFRSLRAHQRGKTMLREKLFCITARDQLLNLSILPSLRCFYCRIKIEFDV